MMSYDYESDYKSKCSLDYTIELRKHNTETNVRKVHILLWSFDCNFINYQEQNIRLCETENVAQIKDIQFRLKFKFSTLNKDLIDIYYLYPEHVVLEEAVLRLQIFYDNIYEAEAEDPYSPLITMKNCEVTANKWQILYSLSKRNTVDNYDTTSTFKFKFEFIMANLPSNKTSIFVVPEHQLSNDFENLLLDSMHSDVILRSAEGFEFKVHKGVLSSRSTVLKAHFAYDTLENKNNILESHFDTEVLKEVLTYIYTGRNSRIQEIPDKLLEAGEFYNLPGLKIASEQSLHLQLTKDNAIRTLQLADSYSATSLKQLTLEFIKDGHAGVITKTDDWKTINSDLIKTLYEFVMS